MPASGDSAVCSALVVDASAVSRVLERVAGAECVERTAAIFDALADRTRVRVLDALSAEDLCVCDIAAVVGVSQSAISHQLRLLRDRGLVAYRREGNRAIYRLADDHVRVLLSQGFAHADEVGASR